MRKEADVASSATWREQAVARSLDSARLRAESRLQRFLDAALELTAANGNEFTVQEVVERSGQSLRSFYQYFGGKQELLFALFEESVRSTAEQLRERIAGEDDPLERLRLFVVEYYRYCRPARRGKPAKNNPAPALAEFAQRLLTSQPKEAARAFAPLVELFEDVFASATAAGAVRPELQSRRVAGVILEAIMFNTFSSVIGGSANGDREDPAEALWDLLFRGMQAT
jgi:AcrR family transcriptional regulator